MGRRGCLVNIATAVLCGLMCGCSTISTASGGGSHVAMTPKESAVASSMGIQAERNVETGGQYSKIKVLSSGFPYRGRVDVKRCSTDITIGPLVVKEGNLKAVEGYLKRLGINAVVGSDVPANTGFRVSIDRQVNLCSFLEDVARQTNVNFFMPDSRTVVFTTYGYEVFSMPLLPGVQNISLTASESDSIGTSIEGKGGAGGHGGIISASSSIVRDAYQEIQSNLNQILQGKGFFFFDKSVGDVHIFAPPEKLLLAKQYLESAADRLGKQIVIRVTVLSVEGGTNRQAGVDWYWALRQAIVNNPWKWGMTSGTVNFSWGTQTRASTEGTYNFGMSALGNDPHRFIIKLLKEYADVQVIDQTEVSIVNGMGTFVSSGEYTEYIKKLERTSTGESNSTSIAVEKGTTFSGLRLYVSGSVLKDLVNLQFYLDMEELLELKSLTFGDNLMVQNPTVSKHKNMTTVQARDGETVALVSMLKDESSKRKTGPGVPILDTVLGQHSSNQSRKHMVFLITPKVVNRDADVTVSGGVRSF